MDSGFGWSFVWRIVTGFVFAWLVVMFLIVVLFNLWDSYRRGKR